MILKQHIKQHYYEGGVLFEVFEKLKSFLEFVFRSNEWWIRVMHKREKYLWHNFHYVYSCTGSEPAICA